MGDTHIGPTNLASRTVAVQGTKLHFHEAGVGETLVLLHGGGPGASGWSNFGGNVAALAEQFHVVVPDQPGYGLADKPEFDGDYWTFAARCIADLLSSLGVEKAHFVGNSMGGGTTVRLALDRPDCIDRMILMGPAGVSVNVVTPHPSEGLKILSSFYDAPGPSRDRMAAFIRMMVFDPAMVTDELITERLEAAMDPDARAGALRAVRSIMSSPDASCGGICTRCSTKPCWSGVVTTVWFRWMAACLLCSACRMRISTCSRDAATGRRQSAGTSSTGWQSTSSPGESCSSARSTHGE